MVTSSVDGEQTPLEMVHRSVAVLPAGKPVTVVVLEFGSVMVAVPLINDHDPVPTVGMLAAMVKFPSLH